MELPQTPETKRRRYRRASVLSARVTTPHCPTMFYQHHREKRRKGGCCCSKWDGKNPSTKKMMCSPTLMNWTASAPTCKRHTRLLINFFPPFEPISMTRDLYMDMCLYLLICPVISVTWYSYHCKGVLYVNKQTTINRSQPSFTTVTITLLVVIRTPSENIFVVKHSLYNLVKLCLVLGLCDPSAKHQILQCVSYHWNKWDPWKLCQGPPTVHTFKPVHLTSQAERSEGSAGLCEK